MTATRSRSLTDDEMSTTPTPDQEADDVPGAVPERVIVFLHVPKTAGTSLWEWMRETIRPGLLCPDRHRMPSDLPPERVAELASYRAFAGHFDVIDLESFPRPRAVFTVVRDPVEMLISLYDYWRAHEPSHVERHNLVGPRLASRCSFEEFVGDVDPRIVADLDNTLVRTFTGLIRTNAPIVDRERSLAEAIARVETFDHVGHVAHLGRTFAWLAGELGLEWESSAPVPRSNVRGEWADAHLRHVERTKPSPRALEAIEPLVALDRRLVEHCFPSAT